MKIVHEYDEDYHEDFEFAVVGDRSIIISYDHKTADAGMAFEDMMFAGLLSEHAPSGMKFEQVGYDDWEWEWHSWEDELADELAWEDDVDAAVAGMPVAC